MLLVLPKKRRATLANMTVTPRKPSKTRKTSQCVQYMCTEEKKQAKYVDNWPLHALFVVGIGISIFVLRNHPLSQ